MTGRKWLGALTLLATLISSSSYASGPLVESRALGMVMMRTPSAVMINGAPAISGTTVFPGDVLQTRDASTAVVRLRSGASLAMSENSEVALDWADPAAGTERMSLHRGAINLNNPRPQAEWVTVPGASVLVQGEGAFPAICRLAAVGQSSAVINDRGRVEIRGSGAPVILPRGQSATLEAGRPQAGGQEAGAVTAEIPRGNVKRNGQTTPIPLKLNDNVYFMDVVRTETLGRVRIQLKDGSTLNIGARSEMTITKHEAQSRQTEIELAAGKLRSKVEKLDATNGQKFEIKTPTAVIGVVGTEFIVESDNHKDKRKRKTLVWCLEGSVNVRNLDAAIVGVVVLHAGEFTSISFGQPPAAATSVPPSAMQMQVSQTDATGVSGAGGMGSMGTVANVGAMGAGAVGAATAGVAMSRANSATNLLNQAGSTLNSATSNSNNANSNANSALNSANSANQAAGNAIGTLTGLNQELVSPTYPCGCH